MKSFVAPIVALSLISPTANAQDTAARTATPAQVSDAKVAGQDVPVPSRKKYVAPEYPADAAAQGIRGIVILELLIGEDGRVESARVTRSISGLDEAAIAAVKLWEYEPTKLAGKPVKVLHSQGITFTMKLPELQRSTGVPELRSGGSPPSPAGLTAPATAAVSISLNDSGEVREVAYLDGNSAVSDALLRVVRSWRFVVAEGAPPPSFTLRAEWKPGPPAAFAFIATDARTGTGAPAAGTSRSATTAAASPTEPTIGAPAQTPLPAPSPTAAKVNPPAEPETEVISARPDPPTKEEGMSLVSAVTLGENIPELVRGRRPVWPPLARLGNTTGEVVVRFSVDLAGKVTVHSAEGHELLKASAEAAVGTWLFRRTAIDRLNLIATFTFTPERSLAKVVRAP